MKEKNYDVLSLWPTPIYISQTPVKKSYLDFIKKIDFERATNKQFDISKDKRILNKMKDLKSHIQNHIDVFTKDYLKYVKKAYMVEHHSQCKNNEYLNHFYGQQYINQLYNPTEEIVILEPQDVQKIY